MSDDQSKLKHCPSPTGFYCVTVKTLSALGEFILTTAIFPSWTRWRRLEFFPRTTFHSKCRFCLIFMLCLFFSLCIMGDWGRLQGRTRHQRLLCALRSTTNSHRWVRSSSSSSTSALSHCQGSNKRIFVGCTRLWVKMKGCWCDWNGNAGTPPPPTHGRRESKAFHLTWIKYW